MFLSECLIRCELLLRPITFTCSTLDSAAFVPFLALSSFADDLTITPHVSLLFFSLLFLKQKLRILYILFSRKAKMPKVFLVQKGLSLFTNCKTAVVLKCECKKLVSLRFEKIGELMRLMDETSQECIKQNGREEVINTQLTSRSWMQIRLLIPFGAFFSFIVPQSTNVTEMFWSPEVINTQLTRRSWMQIQLLIPFGAFFPYCSREHKWHGNVLVPRRSCICTGDLVSRNECVISRCRESAAYSSNWTQFPFVLSSEVYSWDLTEWCRAIITVGNATASLKHHALLAIGIPVLLP